MPWNVGDKTIFNSKMATITAQNFVSISKNSNCNTLKYNANGDDHKGDRTNHAEVRAMPWNVGYKTIYNLKMVTNMAQYFVGI